MKQIQEVTGQLLNCGAKIEEINTIRKRLSAVKGGKLAALAGKTPVFQIVLSDIIDDNLQMISSGPACADSSKYEDVVRIRKKYQLEFPASVEKALKKETVRELSNVTTVITGSVRQLCRAAAECAERLGYRPYVLTTSLDGEAREAGRFLASAARIMQKF